MPQRAPLSPTDYATRARTLESARTAKMSRDAHAYVRGSTIQFYAWLDRVGASLPQGPPVWICGDCHVGNLGPVAAADGRVEIEIRDLDQTVVGNPAHDIVRLALSLAMAARSSDLPGVTTARIMEHLMEGYQSALHHASATSTADAPDIDLAPIRNLLATALKRRWKHLASDRIDDPTPTIPLGKRFWALNEEEHAALTGLFAQDEVRHLITHLKSRDNDAKVKLVDAAYWMKGCSSLGKIRYAALIGVGKRDHRQHCLIDIKEAVSAAAPAAAATKSAKSAPAHARATSLSGPLSSSVRRRIVPPTQPENYAERVVSGARALSPFLGNRMLAATLLRKPVVIRELLPQDLKLEMSTLTCEQAVGAARFLAAVVGRAHARQLTPAQRKKWSAELARNHSKSLDAPGWLWSSVVQLVAEHEAAYLNHCRRYATTT